jgi:hypothetical protein
MVSIQILSWNRPFIILLTLLSIKRVLINAAFDYEFLILDQNSNWITKQIIKLFKFDKVIEPSKNIGMANAWTLLNSHRSPNSKFILQLENDWWCCTKNFLFFLDAISVLNSSNEVAFVKLRRNFDFQAGAYMINKEPQTVYPLPLHIFKYLPLNNANFSLISDSRFSCFTFNPTLMQARFRDEVADAYTDNMYSSISILRSGEDFPTKFWETQNRWRSAVISNAPFIHTGFHSRRFIILSLPIFYLIEIFLWIDMLIFKIASVKINSYK